jgi:single-strand DNA-binding protein
MEISADATTPSTVNSVVLVGRVSSAPEDRVLPSGDKITTFRVVVRRQPTPMTKGSKQVSDWVDCTVWGGRARRAVRHWQVDDVVEVEGALRRRYARGGGAAAGRVEVEVLTCRRLVRPA